MLNRRRSRNLKKAYLVLFIFLVLILGFAGVKLWKYLAIGMQVVTSNKINLKQTPESRINLLLLGVGGGTHEGPNLTDTIILASIDPATKKAVLVSVPRDIWIADISGKINSAYQVGEDSQTGSGLITSKAVVSKRMGDHAKAASREPRPLGRAHKGDRWQKNIMETSWWPRGNRRE